MKRILFDTNVILDVLLDRQPYVEASAAAWAAVETGAARVAGCECIVTRDPKGFRGSPVRCLTLEAVAPLLDSACAGGPTIPARPR